MDIKDREKIKYVLLYALGEYRDRRTPVDEYVEKRYDKHADSFKISKLVDVQENVELASELRKLIDDLLDAVCGSPEGEVWVVYSQVKSPWNSDVTEFAHFAVGSFDKVAKSLNEVYIPISQEEFAAVNNEFEKFEDLKGVDFLRDKAMEIAKEDGRPHYTIEEWKKVPIVRRTVRRTDG